MTRRRALLPTLLAAALLVPPVAAADRPVSAPGGPQLRDGAGRRLQLHGVNLVPKCAGAAVPAATPGTPCAGRGPGAVPGYVVTADAADPGRRFTAADARTLARLGFSAVRLGLIWEGLEPGPPGATADDPRWCTAHVPGTPYAGGAGGPADPWDPAAARAYLDRVAATVGLLRGAGLRVLLDVHQDGYGSAFGNADSPTPWQAEGAPPWATCTDGQAFGAPARWQSSYGDPAVGTAIAHFMANDVSGDLQGNYARALEAVAKRFASNPAVIGYELYNEPINLHLPGGFDAQLQCLYAGSAAAPASCAATDPDSQAPAAGLIATLQRADPDGLVLFEPPVLSEFGTPEAVGITEALPFGRLGLSFHVYGLPTLTKQQFDCTDPACATSETQTIATLLAERARTRTRQPGGPPAILTEFGAESHVPDIARVARLAEHDHLSWFYWSAFGLHDPTGGPGQALIDDATRRPLAAKARALAVAYPLATAGDVTAQAFAPATGRFTLTYRVDRAVRAPTVVVVPRLQYPKGYGVTVTGAHVTSRPGATRLTLGPARGARTVRLVVRRRGSS